MVESTDLRSQTNKPEDVRAHILRVAAELFAARGVDISMRALAEEIGYTATTIYLYFENKQALLFAVVDTAFADFAKTIREAREHHDEPRDQLTEMGWSYFSFAMKWPHHYRLMFIRQPQFLIEAPPRKHQIRMRAFDILVDVVRDGLGATRRTQRVERTADAIWSAVHGIVMLHLSMPSEFDEARTKRAMKTVIDMTVAMLDD